jgi:hypothetical protein
MDIAKARLSRWKLACVEVASIGLVVILVSFMSCSTAVRPIAGASRDYRCLGVTTMPTISPQAIERAVKNHAKIYRHAKEKDPAELRALDVLQARVCNSQDYKHAGEILHAIGIRRHGHPKPLPYCNDNEEHCWDQWACGEMEECGSWQDSVYNED